MSNIETLVDFIKTNLKDLIICHNLDFDFTVSIPLSQEQADKGEIYFGGDHCHNLIKSCLGKMKFDDEGVPEIDPSETINNIDFAINYLEPGSVYHICYGNYELVILYSEDKMYYLDSNQDRFIEGIPSISEYRIQETNKDEIIKFINACLRHDIVGYCEFVSTSSYFNESVRTDRDAYLGDIVTVSKFETDFELDKDFLLSKIVEFANNEIVYFDNFDYNDNKDMKIHLEYIDDEEYRLAIIENFEEVFNKLKIFFNSLNRLTQNKYSPLLKSIFSKIEETISILLHISADQCDQYLKSHFNELNMMVKIKYFKDTKHYEPIIKDFKANLERIDNILDTLDASLVYKHSEDIRNISIKNHELLTFIDNLSVFEGRELISIHLRVLDDIKKLYYRE